MSITSDPNQITLSKKDHCKEMKILIPGATQGPIVLSKRFEEFEKLLIRDANYRENIGGDKYNVGSEVPRLLEIVNAHIEERSAPITQDHVLSIVHPFYLHLCGWHYLSKKQRREGFDYGKKLINTLQRRPNGLGVLLFDTLQHYASVTHLLVEQGLVDQVILTNYNDGKPLKDEAAIRDLPEKKYYFVGGESGGYCLNSIIIRFNSEKKEGDLFAIPELCYNTHQSKSSLIETPDSIDCGLPLEQNVTIEELFERAS